MFDHLLGLILLGLGISSPMSPQVKGDSTQQQELSGGSSGGGSNDSGASGATGVSSTSGRDSSGSGTSSGSGSSSSAEPETEIHTGTGDSVQRPATGSTAAFRDSRLRTGDGRDIELTGLHGKKFTLRGELELDVEKSREEASGSMHTKMQSFTTKLQTIKDVKKQETVSDIQTRINELNTKRTDKMTQQLNTMTDIMVRIASMGAALKAKGTDTGTLDSAITAAGTAITAAQDAVVTQAGKSYVVTISTEKNLKTDVGTILKTMQSDLKKVYTTVVDARKAISNAISVLAKLRGEAVPAAVIR